MDEHLSGEKPLSGFPISVVILAKNEEVNLRRCLKSLEWAGEVVVIDDGSVDGTVSIASELGARVVDHSFESFASQRNWALQHAELQNDWVLMLDADEAVPPEFAKGLAEAIRSADPDVVAFKTCRKTMFGKAWLRWSDGFPVWIMRVVRRGQAEFEDSGHGEVPVPQVTGRTGVITQPFLHYPFSRGMDDWWQRHVRYAGREAQREVGQAVDAGIGDLASLDRSRRRRGLRACARKLPFRGPLRFLYQYVLRGGFLDGRAGLQFCRMMACYESMISIRSAEPMDNGTG